jgi:hypothetical protein
VTFHPEGQIVASAKIPGGFRYTAKHDARHWTVEVREEDFAGLNVAQRRALLAQRVTMAMRGPPDDA